MLLSLAAQETSYNTLRYIAEFISGRVFSLLISRIRMFYFIYKAGKIRLDIFLPEETGA